MPKCPRCKQMKPKESFYTPGGYRCVKCADCRAAAGKRRQALRAEQAADRREAEAALRRQGEETARKPVETSKPDKLPMGKSRAVVRMCAFCGEQFERPNRRAQKYCSVKCRLEAAKARMKTAEPKSPGPKPLRTCAECGKLFRPVNANQITCCKECKTARFKRVRRGEVRQPRPFALSFDPYEDNRNWAGVPMNSTSFNPLG